MLSIFVMAPKALARGLLVAFILLCGPAFAQSGPVGWWKLDEGSGTTTADSSGNAHNGTLTNSPTWTTGRVGPSALTFNGTTAQVGVSGSAPLANLYTAGFTVSAWIKPAGAGGGNAGRIVDKDNNSAGWFFAMSGATQIRLTSDQDPSGVTSMTSTATIALNTWQHVAATWDGHSGGQMHVYINGVQADSATTAGGAGTEADDSATPLTIGDRPLNDRGFNGSIDEVRIYNRILSAAEIQALADSTPPSAPTGLNATANSSSQINLTWTASTDNVGVTGYLLDRCTGAGCSSFAQIAAPTTTSYNNAGLTASTSYSYRVRATDANTNVSGYSATASATTASGGDTTPPSVPGNLRATNFFTTQINLAWDASTDNVGVAGYSLERCAGDSCTNFRPIASPTGTAYNDTGGLSSSTSYSYRVRAYDAALNYSGYSSPVLTVVTYFNTSGAGSCTP